MGKKVLINERQLALLVNHIKENEKPIVIKEEQIIEEGFKDWVISGLMVLASIGGIKAQDNINITPKHIEDAQEVQNKLNSGDLDGDGTKDLKQYFRQADIELNQANLSKLMKVDVKSELKSYKTKSLSSAKSKMKQGYTLSDIKITKDTVWSDIPQPAYIDTNIISKFNGNFFETGTFRLNEDVKNEIDFLISAIESMNGTIKSINIESSTDTEPIKMGNEKLAKLRADGITKYLNNMGIDTSLIKIVTKPEQGPDIFSKTMSNSERESARQQTEEFRYVTLEIEFEISPSADTEKTVSQVLNKIEFELIRVKPKYKTKKIRIKRSTGLKKSKCKIKPSKGPITDCFEF